MECDWCGYDLDKVYIGYNGCIMFNNFNEALSYRMCSLNCCCAKIEELGGQILQMQQNLYSYYNVTGYIKEAKDKSKLKRFGGNLSYDEYRKNFTIPLADEDIKYKYDSYDDCSEEYKVYKEEYEYELFESKENYEIS
jgi:hypothetical protein